MSFKAAILSLEFQQFRRWQGKKLSFLGPDEQPLPLVVLAGPNGSGKTSVLEAILLGLGRADLIVRDLPAEDRERFPRGRLGPTESLGMQILLWENGPVHPPARLSGIHSSAGADWGRHIPLGRAILDDQASQKWDIVEYFSSTRKPAFVGPLQDSPKGRPPDNNEANRIWRFLHLLLQQQSRRVNPRYQGSTLDLEWLDQLNRFWRKFRADGTSLDLDLVDPEDREKTEWNLYLFHQQTRICSLDALSSGEIQILNMVVPFITRTEPFQGILLIDEPELHLHPEWQVGLLPALATLLPDAQIIAATHSALIREHAYSFENYLLVEEGDPRGTNMRGFETAP